MKSKLVISDHMDATARRIAELGETENSFEISPNDVRSVDGCPLCGASDIVRLTEVYFDRSFPFFSTAACRNCHYTFRITAPKNDWFRKCWRQIETDDPEVFNPGIEALREKRYEVYADILGQYLTSGRILDIGAAFGSGAQLLRQRGYEVEALEPEFSRATYLNRKLSIPTHNTIVEEFQATKPYDAIVFSQCLEHVDDPVRALEAVVASLRPVTGILYLEVPILWHIVDWKDAFFMAHKSNFTEGNVFDLVHRMGLKVIETRHLNMNSPTAPDIALVLQAPGSEADRESVIPPSLDEGRKFEEIPELYRRGLPVSPQPEMEATIRYNICGINHFYHTVRFIEGAFVDHRSDTGFIEFVRRD